MQNLNVVTHPNVSSRLHWALLLILLVGLVLLLWHLDDPGLWVDEGWSMIAASRADLSETFRMIREDVHPPLHTLLLAGWQSVAGQSVFAGRYSTALTVLVACAVLYRAGRALFGVQTGMVAVALFLLNNQVITLGQEVRQYALAQMLAALTLWAYWRCWQRPSRKRHLLFALVGALSLWNLYWSGFVLLGTGLHALLTCRRSLRSWIITYGIMALAFLPWVPVLIAQMTQGIPSGLGHALPNTQDGLNIVLFQLLGRPELFWMMLAAAGALYAGAGRRPGAAHLLPAVVIITGVGMTLFINNFYSVMTYRAMSVFLPALLLLMAAAVTAFRRPERYIMLVMVLAMAILPGAGQQLRLPWPQVAAFTSQNSAAGDRVLIATCFDTFALAYYLERQPGAPVPVPVEAEACIRQRDDLEAYLQAQIADTDGLWVIDYASTLNLAPVLQEAGFIPTGIFTWETPFAPVVGYRYDRPPEATLHTVFGSTLALHNAQITPHADGVTVTLLWMPLAASPNPYTVSVFLLDDQGILVAQHDSYPLYGTALTSAWQPGSLYFDSHFLPMPAALPGSYRAGIKVYTFVDSDFQQIEIIPPMPCADANCTYYLLDETRQ